MSSTLKIKRMNSDFAEARFNMVQQQVRPWDVLDPRVLEMMEHSPREAFVPVGYEPLAYADIEIPLADGEFMMAPRLEARLLQALDIQPGNTVLEIGTGSGCLAACMARLGGQVKSVEINASLAEQATKRLQAQGVENVNVVVGDGLEAQRGLFDIIAVTGSIPDYTDQFKENLNVGGRLFVVTGAAEPQSARLITRVGQDSFADQSLFETVLRPLRGAPEPDAFVF